MYERSLNIIEKYTGADVSEEWYMVNVLNGPQGEAINYVVQRIISVEKKMNQDRERLLDVAEKIEHNLNAGPDDQVIQLNSLGELQNERVDAYIMVRAELIDILNTLVHSTFEA